MCVEMPSINFFWISCQVMWKWVKSLSRVQLFATPWTVAYQASLSMGFSRQEYWSGLPFPSPGDLPDPGIEPRSPALEAAALTSEPQGSLLWNTTMIVFLADITLMNLSSLAFWSDGNSEKANVLIHFYLVLTMRMKDSVSFSNLACHCSFTERFAHNLQVSKRAPPRSAEPRLDQNRVSENSLWIAADYDMW